MPKLCIDHYAGDIQKTARLIALIKAVRQEDAT
jgi:hypothetical protein